MVGCLLPWACGSTGLHRRITWSRRPIHLVASQKKKPDERGKGRVLTFLSKDTSNDQTSFCYASPQWYQLGICHIGFEGHAFKQHYARRKNIQALLARKEQRVCLQPVVSTPTHFTYSSPESGKVLFT